MSTQVRVTRPARFRGVAVSAGRAVGVLRIADSDNSNKRGGAGGRGGAAAGSATADDVMSAFAAVSAQRSALAARLRAAGRDEEAGIIEVAALIAADPALSVPAADAVRGGCDPAVAIREAAGRQARLMEKLDNPSLAARAADIRQVADAALDFLGTDNGDSPAPAGSPAAVAPGERFILVRREISAAELIELADAADADDAAGGRESAETAGSVGSGEADGAGPVLVGAVSVMGGASSHAAIIARGLGLPMIAGADPAILEARSGQLAVLDADAGTLTVGEQEPAGKGAGGPGLAGGDEPRSAGALARSGPAAGALAGTPVGLPAAGPVRTADGTEISVLCNVASAAETRRGLAAGAEGVGLLRTEIPYLESGDWPSGERQREQLAPILSQLAGKPAVVRLLDFSGDKIPVFIDGRAGAGLAALLDHPTALASQLGAILRTGGEARLAILIPMVREPREIARVREVLARVAAERGVPAPPVGIMVELAATARRAAEFARHADFFSIGTNDLTGDVLGLSRRDPAAGPGLAADPRVLALVRQVADAGRDAGIEVSVCGDAAGDTRVLPLLIAAGIRTVSVGAGGVGAIRSALREITTP